MPTPSDSPQLRTIASTPEILSTILVGATPQQLDLASALACTHTPAFAFAISNLKISNEIPWRVSSLLDSIGGFFLRLLCSSPEQCE